MGVPENLNTRVTVQSEKSSRVGLASVWRQLLATLASTALVVGVVAAPSVLAQATAPSAAAPLSQTTTKQIKTLAKFYAGKAKLTSASKKRIRKAVKQVNRLKVAKRNQSLLVTARAAGSCATARSATVRAGTRGEVSCAWRVLANKRAKTIKKYVRSAGFKGKIATKKVRVKHSRVKRALAPAVSALVFHIKTAVKPPAPTPTPTPPTPTSPTPTPPTVPCADGGPCVVGDIGPGGGTVLYVAPSEQSWGTYIEAAPESVSHTLQIWGCYGLDFSGADDTGIGDGATNTADILAQQDECSKDGGYAPNAALAASNYMGVNGATPGWYLPSKDELNQVCLWRSSQATGVGTESDECNGDGVADPYPYWSSTQSTVAWAWYQSMASGSQNTGHKDAVSYVWPVRAFNPTVN